VNPSVTDEEEEGTDDEEEGDNDDEEGEEGEVGDDYFDFIVLFGSLELSRGGNPLKICSALWYLPDPGRTVSTTSVLRE
jgi:hypothetical protein